ncbi:hypothetical protein PR048_001666 [Dryococelus australis]|uniref:Uncharacterized protein n=1 Tax=Dryococelus australis TaxID=614101 RepID=A0ABQ9II36_9NEOP|nr:hypothetical protein PR048_001666 [Dryococelus australis]
MTRKNTGLMRLLRKNYVDVPVLHCIIHQEVLCNKFVKMNNVIRIGGNRAQSHRKLVEFLKELSVEFHDIPLHSEICWLSAEDLKSDLKIFKSCSEIKNEFNSADFKQHEQYVIELREEFEKRFSDFDNMIILQLFADPMAVTIEDQDPELQMELCELHSTILLSSKPNLTYGQLWNFVMPDKYPSFTILL